MKRGRLSSLLLVVLLAACGSDAAPPPSEAGANTPADGAARDVDAAADPADSALSDASLADRADIDSDTDSDGEIAAIVGLSRGSHLGVFDGYELPGANAAAAVAAHKAELRAAGSDVARVHVSFRELSPAPGRVDLSPLLEALNQTDADTRVLVLIETIDSEGFLDAMPPDLVGSSPYALRDGLTLDAPEVVARFGAVLQTFAATDAFRQVVALSVGNEPDTYYDDITPSSREGLAYAASLGGFVAGARAVLRSVGSSLPVAMTLRAALAKQAPDTLRTLLAQGDVAVFNYYGQDTGFRVIADTLVRDELAALVAFAGDKPVILQEVGCPAGIEGGQLGSSEAAQAAFFSALLASMQSTQQLRMAFVFQLVDWSPTLAASYGAAYASAGFPELGGKVEESLRSSGLLRYADGSARPAFEVVRSAIAALSR